MVLCDPVKRVVSLYTHINSYKLRDGTDPLPAFTDLVQLQGGRLIEKLHPRVSQPFLECGMYSKFIKQWLQAFPLHQMAFISGEMLVENPLSQVSKITAFLGKADAVTADNVYKDEERGYFCFRSSRGEEWCMDRKKKGRKHPQLSDSLIKALQDHYRPYNEELKSLIKQDFGWPKYLGQK